MKPDISNIAFQRAVAFVNQTNKHLFVSGKAGTGKTTFLKFIKENTFKKMVVLAPTGVAAINAGGVTVHSFFQLPLGTFIPSDKITNTTLSIEVNTRTTLLQGLRLTTAKKQLLQELELLVIDEVSMIRADLLDAVDTVMRHVRKRPTIPFGGVQMVYIGDLYQLPPVVRDDEWDIMREYYAHPFFFEAHALQHAPPLPIELKKIYRQQDTTFINILNNIRNNCCTANDLRVLEQHYQPEFEPFKGEGFITLCSHNHLAHEINRRQLEKLEGRIYHYSAEISGEFNESAYPAEKQLQLKQGAQVMFIRNDKGEERKYFNGKIGVIKKIEQAKIVVSFSGSQEEIDVEPEKWQNVRYRYNQEKEKLEEEEIGSFSQYPLRLAWAITIHKSQGLTFEKAIIDAGASFAPGQVYVALSRLTKLEGLVLKSKILPHSISTDSRVMNFVSREPGEASLEQTLQREQEAFVAQRLTESYSMQRIVTGFQNHLESYNDKRIPEKENAGEWAAKLLALSMKLNEVAIKFQKQLEQLFPTARQDGYKKVYERVEAASRYFITEMEPGELSIKEHINITRQKPKVKKYVKELQELLQLFYRKKQQLDQAVQIAAMLKKTTTTGEVLNILETQRKALSQVPAESNDLAIKTEKGESSRISLELFKQGKTILEISTARELTPGTVEGHLAGFITTGDVHIYDLADRVTVERLLAIIEAEPASSHSAIKQKAGEAISYGTIKAVKNYFEMLKKESA